MNDLSASSRIAYQAALVQPGAVRRIRGLSDKALAWLFITPTIVLLLAINIQIAEIGASLIKHW